MSTTGRWAISISLVAHAALLYASTVVDFPRLDQIRNPRELSVELVVQRPAPVIEVVAEEASDVPLPEPPVPEAEPVIEEVAEPPERFAEEEIDEEDEGDEDWARRTAEQRARLQITDLEFATALALARARERINGEDGDRTFGFADLFPEEELREPGADRNAFASPSAGRAGLTEMGPTGQLVTWISDECYRTAGYLTPLTFPAAADIYNMGMTNCVSTKPRRDLFEHLKRD